MFGGYTFFVMFLTILFVLLLLFCNRLHTLLLQPRGAQSTGKGSANTAETACPSKVKKTIGKIRVEGIDN